MTTPATPAFFWYPIGATSGTTLETTDLLEVLSSLEEEPIREVEDARGTDGGYTQSSTGSPRLAVHLRLERFINETLACQIMGLQSALERGWAVGFCADQSQAWAGFATATPSRGDTSISVGLAAFPGSGTLSAGSWISVEGLGSQGCRELVKVLSIATGTITLDSSTPLLYTYDDSCVLVRHRDYYPVVVWPKNRRRQPIITTSRRINWTLDVTLETEPALIAAYQSEEGGWTSSFAGVTSSSGAVTHQTFQAYDPTGPGLTHDLFPPTWRGFR